jgi:hypothetical protein
MKKVLSVLGVYATLAAGLVQPAFAAENVNLQVGGEWGALGNLTFGGIVAALIKLVLVLAAVIFFFMLVWGGVQFIISGGDKQGTESARGRITFALIGLVIVFTAWALTNLVGAFFGINIFQLNVPVVGQ